MFTFWYYGGFINNWLTYCFCKTFPHFPDQFRYVLSLRSGVRSFYLHCTVLYWATCCNLKISIRIRKMVLYLFRMIFERNNNWAKRLYAFPKNKIFEESECNSIKIWRRPCTALHVSVLSYQDFDVFLIEPLHGTWTKKPKNA